MNERRLMLSAFYEGSIWCAHCDAAIATMIDSENVLLLRPTHDRSANSAVTNRRDTGSFGRDALVVANIHYVDRSAIKDFTQFFEKTMDPVLKSTGAHVIAAFETDPTKNTFLKLPVRESETVLIWLTSFRDARQFEDHVTALRRLPDWRKHARPDVLRQFSRKPEVLKLAPTPRSQLKY